VRAARQERFFARAGPETALIGKAMQKEVISDLTR
jgi:hypothetical protein